VGRDQVVHELHGAITVSIRAPAWGATVEFAASLAGIEFQSARPRGARPLPSTAMS